MFSTSKSKSDDFLRRTPLGFCFLLDFITDSFLPTCGMYTHITGSTRRRCSLESALLAIHRSGIRVFQRCISLLGPRGSHALQAWVPSGRLSLYSPTGGVNSRKCRQYNTSLPSAQHQTHSIIDSKCATSCQVRRHNYAHPRSFRAENMAPRPPKATCARLLRVEEIPFHGLFIPRSAESPLRFRECVRGTSCGPASPPQTRLSRESRLSELP